LKTVQRQRTNQRISRHKRMAIPLSAHYNIKK